MHCIKENKFFFLLAVATLLLAGCTQNALQPTPPPAPPTPSPEATPFQQAQEVQEIIVSPTPSPSPSQPPSTPTPSPSPTATPQTQLNPAYQANLTPIKMPENLFPGDARKVFKYEKGELFLPQALIYSQYEPNTYNYYVLQFDGEPYPPRIEQLKLLQVKFSWPVKENAFIIYCNTATFTQAATYRDVGFTTPYHPAFKISEPLFYATGPVRVKASFFRGENEATATQAIASLGGNIESVNKMNALADAPGGEASTVFVIDAQKIPAIANLTAVHWLEKA